MVSLRIAVLHQACSALPQTGGNWIGRKLHMSRPSHTDGDPLHQAARGSLQLTQLTLVTKLQCNCCLKPTLPEAHY